jgi:hypothetical protein
MKYHIPSDEQLRKAVLKVLQSYRIISSQQRLKELVEKQLKTKKKDFHVSPARLRKIVLQKKLAKIEIHSREGDPHKILYKCPVCGYSLKRVKNLTIWGGEVTIEFRCSFCGYWTGKKKRIPTRYVFYIR